MKRKVLLLGLAFCALAVRDAAAQGGPPMITDDPGTPGNGHFEINIATTLTRRPSEHAWELPALDANYGLGDRIQLTLQTSLAVLKRTDHGPVAGLGNVEAALKWRFLDEEVNGISVSTFPRVIFNVVPSSVHRGLADDGTRVQCPMQASRTFGSAALDFEFGPTVSTIGRGEWLYGIVGGIDLTNTTEVMAELQGTARMSFTHDVLTANIGLRQKLARSYTLIASVGHDVRSAEGEPLAFIGYCGVQMVF